MPYTSSYNSGVERNKCDVFPRTTRIKTRKEIKDCATKAIFLRKWIRPSYAIGTCTARAHSRPRLWGDLGFEPTRGATSADAKPTKRPNKTIEVGEAYLRRVCQQRGFNCGASVCEF